MSKTEIQEKRERLDRLQRESQDVVDEITVYYECLLEEFERAYPPLSRVQDLHLAETTMKRWLTERLEREV